MALLGLMQLALLTAGLFGAVTAIAIALSYPMLAPRLARLPPDRRARVLTMLAVAPLVIGVLHTALCFVPGALGILWPALDHCFEHGAHPHLCPVHLPGSAGSTVGWLAAGLLFGAPLLALLRRVPRVLRARNLVRALTASAQAGPRRGTRRVEAARPFAAAAEGHVLLSAGLVEQLSDPHLDVVVAHEQAHLQRRDPLLRSVVGLLSVGHLPSVGRRLLADLELASEQACDEAAAASVGDRALVAQALLAVERLLGGHQPSAIAAPSFEPGAGLVQRIEALLGPAATAPSASLERRLLAAVALASLAASGPLHHATESLIGLLGV